MVWTLLEHWSHLQQKEIKNDERKQFLIKFFIKISVKVYTCTVPCTLCLLLAAPAWISWEHGVHRLSPCPPWAFWQSPQYSSASVLSQSSHVTWNIVIHVLMKEKVNTLTYHYLTMQHIMNDRVCIKLTK